MRRVLYGSLLAPVWGGMTLWTAVQVEFDGDRVVFRRRPVAPAIRLAPASVREVRVGPARFVRVALAGGATVTYKGGDAAVLVDALRRRGYPFAA